MEISTFYDSPKNWPEDYIHENGNYVNKCCKCNGYFYGHKRRPICKECSGRLIKDKKIADLDLSVRALNCLKALEVETLGDLCEYSEQDLLKFRNFGRKSITEIQELLRENGLSLKTN